MSHLHTSEENLPLTQLLEHFSTHDVGGNFQGTALAFPATTVVFDLAGSSKSIRSRGARTFAAESQQIFKSLSDIIYENNGVIEKFPGDGISMHFPAANDRKHQSIASAFNAIKKMDSNLRHDFVMRPQEYRFSMAYGDDTIITKFGNEFHTEIISIGNAVNVAHKLEGYLKGSIFNLAMDETCRTIIRISGENIRLKRFPLPPDLRANRWASEYYYGGTTYE
ncbi:hypothetical protein [Exiguobacterium sp. CH10]|uniref:hypothetical protein n=1 Tax=Exiguobacterium sp. CH10 TaxID=2751261 RepID=UPI001BE66800|nr:hypothetical protein [Exiguobacterium sp. CH10]